MLVCLITWLSGTDFLFKQLFVRHKTGVECSRMGDHLMAAVIIKFGNQTLERNNQTLSGVTATYSYHIISKIR